MRSVWAPWLRALLRASISKAGTHARWCLHMKRLLKACSIKGLVLCCAIFGNLESWGLAGGSSNWEHTPGCIRALALSSPCYSPSLSSPSFQLSAFISLIFCVSVSLSLPPWWFPDHHDESCTALPFLPSRRNSLKLRARLNLVPFRVFLLGILS